MNNIKIQFHPDTPEEFRNPKGLRSTTKSFGHDLRIAEFRQSPGASSRLLHRGNTIDVTFQVAVDTGEQWAEVGDSDHVGLAAMILPRSGLGTRGLTLANGVGLIDADYTDMLRGRLELAPWAEPILLERWDRVAQLVFVPLMCPTLEVVTAMSSTGRGGFGSTGVA